MTRPHFRKALTAMEHRRRPILREHNRPTTADPRCTAPTRPPVIPQPTVLDQYYATDSTTTKRTHARPSTTHRGARTWQRCPHRPTGMVVNRDTGVLVTPQCRRLRCPSCIVPRAIEVGRAIALANPNLWITLTEVGETWPEVQHGMKMFKQRLRRLGVDGHFAYNLEPSRDGTSHAHLWWRGETVDRATIKVAAASGKFGTYSEIGTSFPATREYSRPTIEYGLKSILSDRPPAPTELWPAARDYLDRNGGRLVHSTRGFWRDHEGLPSTLTAASRSAPGGPGPWLYVRDAA